MTSEKKPIAPAEDTSPEQDAAAEKSLNMRRVAALRLFRVTYIDKFGVATTEHIMAHNVAFPHPREATFHDVAIEGNMALQYTRRAVYNWIDISEETPANTGSIVAQ